MKKSISLLLLSIIIFQSCVVYQKASIPISEVQNKGWVKVVYESGVEAEYNYIEQNGNQFYGVRKDAYLEHKTVIDTVSVSGIYLKDVQKTIIASIAVPVIFIGVLFIVALIDLRVLFW